MSQGLVNLRTVETFVLDEADRMLDTGFIQDIRRIIDQLPGKRQTLFFSATMPGEIQGLADTILRNPVRVAATPVATPAAAVVHRVHYVENKEKIELPSTSRTTLPSRTRWSSRAQSTAPTGSPGSSPDTRWRRTISIAPTANPARRRTSTRVAPTACRHYP
jgi:ABC-type multidrug transport system ATPase subunit